MLWHPHQKLVTRHRRAGTMDKKEGTGQFPGCFAARRPGAVESGTQRTHRAASAGSCLLGLGEGSPYHKGFLSSQRICFCLQTEHPVYGRCVWGGPAGAPAIRAIGSAMSPRTLSGAYECCFCYCCCCRCCRRWWWWYWRRRLTISAAPVEFALPLALGHLLVVHAGPEASWLLSGA